MKSNKKMLKDVNLEDKEILNEVTLNCINELKNRTKHFLISKDHKKTYPTETRGWCREIGHLKHFKCSAEIWIDKHTSQKERRLWYGIAIYDGRNNEKFNELKEMLESLLGKSNEFNELKEVEGYFILPIKNEEYGQLIYENYEIEKYLGIYDEEIPNNKKTSENNLSDRAKDFFNAILDLIPQNEDEKEYPDYPAFENRQIVKKHIYRERRSHLATARKQKDNYICQICNFDFSKTYGNLGNNFAEAHHKIPLCQTNTIRKVSIEDLITVCANCHRMLHRLNGDKNDIEKLKNIISQSMSK